MIFDPSKSCDCSSHNLDIKTGRTRDIAPVPLYMQIYVENNSVIILASKEATKHSWGLLAFLPRVAFSQSQYVPSVPYWCFVWTFCVL